MAWHGKVQDVVRACEHGFFITLLNGLEQSFYQYQERTGTGILDNRQRPLINQNHIANLTADERSLEWQTGQKWYGGRH